jgi:hypothetical protein
MMCLTLLLVAPREKEKRIADSLAEDLAERYAGYCFSPLQLAVMATLMSWIRAPLQHPCYTRAITLQQNQSDYYIKPQVSAGERPA